MQDSMYETYVHYSHETASLVVRVSIKKERARCRWLPCGAAGTWLVDVSRCRAALPLRDWSR